MPTQGPPPWPTGHLIRGSSSARGTTTMYLNGAWDALSAYAVNALKETVRAISVYRKVSKMDEQTRLPTSSAGRLHVTDWAIGVVDDAAVASECARALEDEGFAAHEICIVPGAMAL